MSEDNTNKKVTDTISERESVDSQGKNITLA